MEDKGLFVLLGILILALGVLAGATAFSKTTEIEVPVFIEKLIIPNCSESVLPDFVLTQSDFELRAEETQAEILFLESIDSRDFEKAVYEALLTFVPAQTIDSYKDITSIKYEYNVEGKKIFVENLKVYYFIDGDEEETEKALFDDFKVKIENLDFDELEDAEVNENYLGNLLVNKVY